MFVALVMAAATTRADSILVLNSGVQGHVGVVTAISDLVSLGHSVTTGGTLADYSSFGQVWDLRYNTNFVLDDLTAFSNYLAAGGRLYLAGENPSEGGNTSCAVSCSRWERATRLFLGRVQQPDIHRGWRDLQHTQRSPPWRASGSMVTSGGTGFLVERLPRRVQVAWDGDIAGSGCPHDLGTLTFSDDHWQWRGVGGEHGHLSRWRAHSASLS
jgi:hypothetical protein